MSALPARYPPSPHLEWTRPVRLARLAACRMTTSRTVASTSGPQATRSARGSERPQPRSPRRCSTRWMKPASRVAPCLTSDAAPGSRFTRRSRTRVPTSVSGFDLGGGAIVTPARSHKSAVCPIAPRSRSAEPGPQVALPMSDVVVLNRVVCCYPSADALLANTLGAARNVFAFTAPVDRGLMGLGIGSSGCSGTAGTRYVRRSSAGFVCSSTTSAL